MLLPMVPNVTLSNYGFVPLLSRLPGGIAPDQHVPGIISKCFFGPRSLRCSRDIFSPSKATTEQEDTPEIGQFGWRWRDIYILQYIGDPRVRRSRVALDICTPRYFVPISGKETPMCDFASLITFPHDQPSHFQLCHLETALEVKEIPKGVVGLRRQRE
jgi:hypothetical protein